MVTECARGGGRELVEVVERDGVERQRCRVAQLDRAAGLAGTEAGWFYDDASVERAASCGEDGQRISFTEIARPAQGSLIELECLQTLGLGHSQVGLTHMPRTAAPIAGASSADLGLRPAMRVELRTSPGDLLPILGPELGFYTRW